MRYIYNDHDTDDAPSIISDEAESLVDTIAAALMRGDTDYAYERAQRAISNGFDEGKQTAMADAKAWAEEENRQRAHFGEGKAEFHTSDGLIAHDKIELRRDEYYVPEWRRACRSKLDGLAITGDAKWHEPIPIRTYEFTGVARNGLPVYEEKLP